MSYRPLLVKLGDGPHDEAELMSDMHKKLPVTETDSGFIYAPEAEEVARSFAGELAEGLQTDNLFALGDFFEADLSREQFAQVGYPGVEQLWDTSRFVNIFVNELARRCKRLLVTAGNWDFRRPEQTDDPWSGFDFADNVVFPIGANPVEVEIGDVRVLLGNIFYDLDFLPEKVQTNLTGMTRNELKEVYRKTVPDGKFLFRGPDSIDTLFRDMTAALAAALGPEIDVLACHCPPHPVLAQYRSVPGRPDIPGLVYSSSDWDKAFMERMGWDYPKFVSWFNSKSAFLGSNVLEHELARFSAGLRVLFGHNHKRKVGRKEDVQAREVVFTTYQGREE